METSYEVKYGREIYCHKDNFDSGWKNTLLVLEELCNTIANGMNLIINTLVYTRAHSDFPGCLLLRIYMSEDFDTREDFHEKLSDAMNLLETKSNSVDIRRLIERIFIYVEKTK